MADSRSTSSNVGNGDLVLVALDFGVEEIAAQLCYHLVVMFEADEGKLAMDAGHFQEIVSSTE